MELREVTVRVHDEDGSLWAEVVELPGCFATGDTLEELQESLREALELYLDLEISRFEFGGAQDRVADHRLALA